MAAPTALALPLGRPPMLLLGVPHPLARRDRGATLREVRVDPPRWEAAPTIPRDPIETAGEASV